MQSLNFDIFKQFVNPVYSDLVADWIFFLTSTKLFVYSVTNSFVDKIMTKQNKPTAAELEILSVLWERGAATVKTVHEQLNANKPSGYTTVLKTMQIMRDKGLVKRDDTDKAHVFRAAIEQSETQQNLVADLIEKAFRGSALKLVQHVLEAKPSSAEDLKEIRRMIGEAEAKGETR